MNGPVSIGDVMAGLGRRDNFHERNAAYRSGVPRDQWGAIRQGWDAHRGRIESGGRCDPYWFDWRFTPIEYNAWQSIRMFGVRMYPQCPVGGMFIDFGDPHLKIGLELDGKDYHNVEQDVKRDERLAKIGWQIYRVSGSQAMRRMDGPNHPAFGDEAIKPCEDWERDIEDWAYETMEGFAWALSVVYYGRRTTQPRQSLALAAINSHRYARVDDPRPEESA